MTERIEWMSMSHSEPHEDPRRTAYVVGLEQALAVDDPTWPGFMVTDRVGCPCAWVSFEKDFGWCVYAFGLFRRCIPMGEQRAYTAMNHGLAFGGKLPSDPFALPEAVGMIRWRDR